MNILDEDIGQSQRLQLAAWRIHHRQIGGKIGRVDLKDREGIIPLLRQLKRPTFFTFYPALPFSGRRGTRKQKVRRRQFSWPYQPSR